ncbi:MAG: hypothetical protein WCX69_01930 [Candidatus Paceibacterota bacterium]
MNLKNKIIAGALCVLVSGIGIFSFGADIANANPPQISDKSNETVIQLQLIIESLKQQIQQLIQQISQLKPQETCGNGICRFGETAVTCAADCGKVQSCISEGKPFPNSESYKQCCAGLTKVKYLKPGTSCGGGAACYTGYVCVNCGNGICGSGESAENCAADCGNLACSKEGQIIDGQDPACCSGLTSVSGCNASGDCPYGDKSICAYCGNGVCGLGENKYNCGQDCTSKSSNTTSLRVTANTLSGPTNVFHLDQKALVYGLNIGAIGSDMDVQRITLRFSGAPYNYFSNIYLYDGNTMIAIAPVNHDVVSKTSTSDYEMTLSNFSNKFLIPKGTASLLSVKVDVWAPFSKPEAPAKIYISTVENGVRAVDQSDINHYGGDSSGNMIIVSQSPVCGNGTCETGESASNCPQDCDYTKLTCEQACAKEGFISSASYCNTWTTLPGQSSSTCKAGEFGLASTSDCNMAGVAQYSGKTCCCNRQPLSVCGTTSNPLDKLNCNCKNYCIQNGYAAGSCQNFGIEQSIYIKSANGPSCSEGLPNNYNQTLSCYCKN